MSCPQVGAVILNYNGWQDTLACVESVLTSTLTPKWIIIVDNASTDDSVSFIRQWFENTQPARANDVFDTAKPLHNLPLVDITTGEVPHAPHGRVMLLRTDKNRGYAAGNNAGIRILMQRGADAIWLLNNDTVVDKNALAAMYNRLFSKPHPGLCGARIQYMGTDVVQCRAGGKTNPWTGLSYLDGYRFKSAKALLDSPEVVERRINFIYGASIMVSREFIETVGLMDEQYFLYCEEQDWAYRAKGRFDIAYAPDAVVYHKEGGTTGFSAHKTTLRALWHLTRSRLIVTAKHVPWALPTVCLSIIFAALRMAWRRSIKKILPIRRPV